MAASDFLLAAGALAAGMACGWFGRGWHDGADVTAQDAAVSAQTEVGFAVEADRKVQAARTATETAVERVRTVTRTIEVAAECPPGRGPVSADYAEQLRALAADRAAKRHGSVR